MLFSVRWLVISILLSWGSAFGADNAQTFTLDGQLFDGGNFSTPLLDSVTMKIQILNPLKNCVLYEENQPVNTTNTGGLFNISVGSVIGSPKRTSGVDPGNSMRQIFENSGNITGVGGCVYNASAGHARYLRITVVTSGGATEVLSDMLMDSIPSALVAESVQGLSREDILELNTVAPLTQANVETVFSATNYPKLTSLIDGTSTDYVRTNSGGASVPNFAADPGSPAVGQVWFNTTDGQLKYFDGAVQVIGNGTGSVTSVTAGAGLSGGTITGVGTISMPNVGTPGTYAKVTTDAQGRVSGSGTLDESDIPTLTAAGKVSGSAINTGTIGGNTVISTTGSVSSASSSTRLFDIYDSDNTNFVRLQTVATGSLTGDYTLTLPIDAGLSGQTLTTDGSGNLSWTAPPHCNSNEKLEMSAGPVTYSWSCVADVDTSVTDHGDLTGLADDDHAQYGMLAGRAGGQNLRGGTASGDDLILESTSDAAKGDVILQPNGGNIGLGTMAPDNLLSLSNEENTTVDLRYDTDESTNGVGRVIFRGDSAGNKNGEISVARGNMRRAFNSGVVTSDSLMINSANDMFFTTGPDANDYIRMVLLNNGNVGIGTTSPSVPLTVAGTPGAGIMTLSNGAGRSLNVTATPGSNQSWDLQTNDQFNFVIDSTSRFRVNDAGNVGLSEAGDTVEYRLEVNGSSGNGYFGITNVSDGDILTVNAAGNVGIGTTSPNTKLTVEGAMSLDQLGADAAGAAGYGSLYVKTDGKLYYRDGTGTVTDLLSLGSGGEANTASNVTGGAGVGLFKQKNGVDLEFKSLLPGSTKLSVSGGANDVTLDVVEGNINHDNLAGFVANEHIDHSAVSIGTAAGSALTGGGDLTATRNLAVNVDDSTIEINTNALRVKDGGITNAKIVSMDVDKVTSGASKYFTYMPDNTQCGASEILKWDDTNDRWICGADADSGGDITQVTTAANSGLSGGGTTGAIALSVDSGSDDTDVVTNADVPHCSANQKLEMTTGPIYSWSCAADTAAATALRLVDADNDTKIQVEASADEDKIRFDTAGSERMLIDETGRVGIGDNTPDGSLSINTSTAIPSLAISNSNNTDTVTISKTAGTGSVINATVASGQASGFVYSNTDAATFLYNSYNYGVKSTLTLGIDNYGTIAGSFNASQTRTSAGSNGDLAIGVDATASSAIATAGVYGYAGRFVAGTPNIVPMLIKGAPSQTSDLLQVQDSGGNPKLTVLSDGKVGIGTTTAGVPLQVNGNVMAGGYGLGSPGSSNVVLTNSASEVQLGNSPSFTTTSIYSSSTRALTANGGNVGIGTAAPAVQLQVDGSAGTGYIMARGTAGGALCLQEGGATANECNTGARLDYDGTGNKFSIMTTNGNSWTGTERFTILRDSGNVGIGTTSPGALLDVSGNNSSVVARFYDQTPVAGNTQVIVRAGAGQTGTNLFQIQDSAGSPVSYYDITNASWSAPNFRLGNGIGGLFSSTALHVRSDMTLQWSATTNAVAGKDLGISRRSSGVLAVGNGTASDFSGTLLAGSVGVGTASPNAKLTVEGAMSLDQLASDHAGAAGYGSLYVKTDGKLYYRDGTGTITDLLSLGSGGEANTASNVTGGAGVGLFKQKTDEDLEFKSLLPGSTKLSISGGASDVTLDVVEANINHDNLLGFVGDEHIDHSTVSIATAATSGLSGGGDLTATRNLAVNITGTTGETVPASGDEILIYDTSATALRKMTRSDFLSGYLNASIGVGVGNVMGADVVPSCLASEKLQMSPGPVTYSWSCVADVDTGATDHGALTGLTDDDHTQYAMLAGRAGGQVLRGGTASGDDVTIESTSDATKGFVLLQPNGGNVGIGTAAPSAKLNIQTDAIGVTQADSTGLALINTTAATGGAPQHSPAIYWQGDSWQSSIPVKKTIGFRTFINSVTDLAGNGYLNFQSNSNGGAYADRFAISSNGNLGIGAAPTTTDLIAIRGNLSATIGMARHTTSNTAGNLFKLNAGGATVGATDKNGGDIILTGGTATGTGSSNILFQTATPQASSSTSDNSPTTKMTIVGNGNVGIGTTSPNSKLTVEGVISFDQLGADAAGAAGYGSLYVKTDGKLYYRDGTGTITDLLALGSGGEANTASNVTGGAGVGLFKQKTDEDLEFKSLLPGSTKLSISGGASDVTLDVVEANINHDNLAGFVANEHIDHSAVSIGTAAGSALTGGGDLTATRNLAVNVDDSTIEINTNALRVKDGGITDAKINTVNISKVVSGTDYFTYTPGGTECNPGEVLKWNTMSDRWLCDTDTGATDHGTLTGLTDDDHTQYVMLAGRAGGQVLRGGTASGDDVTIESTSDATKGFVLLQPNGGNVGIGTLTPAKRLHVSETNNAAGRFERTQADHNDYGVFEIARSRSDTTAPNADFGARLDFMLEGFTDGQMPRAASIVSQWEVNQTDDTTSRDSSLSFRTMLNNGNSPSTERMRITSAGNVGIGTTSPGALLQVAGDNEALRIGTNTNNTAYIGFAYNTVGAVDRAQVGYSPTVYGSDTGYVYMAGTNGAKGAGLLVGGNATPSLYVNSSGNVGIGTTNPSTKLEVNGTVTATGFSGPLTSSVVSVGAGAAGAPSISFSGDPDTGFYNTNSNDTISVTAGGTNVFNFTTLGLESTVAGSVHLRGLAGSVTDPAYSFNGDSNTGLYNPADGKIGVVTNGVERMTITAAGNVGIGTTSPTDPLNVHSAGVITTIRVTTAATGATVSDGVALGYQDSLGAFVWNREASPLVFASSNTERMRIDGTGNVGLGTTAPQGILHSYGSTPVYIDRVSPGNGAHLILRGASGTLASPTGVVSGDDIGSISFGGHDSVGWDNPLTGIVAYASETWGDTAHGSYLVFKTTSNTAGTASERMRIDSSGNVGIGTASPGYKLDIASGAIRAGTGSAVNGTTILVDNYSSGALTTFGTEYSSGGPSIGYAVTPGTAAAGTFVSSTPIAIARSALNTGGGDFRFYTGAAQTVAIGSAVTMDEVMRISNTGNVGIGTTNPTQLLEVNGGTIKQVSNDTWDSWDPLESTCRHASLSIL